MTELWGIGYAKTSRMRARPVFSPCSGVRVIGVEDPRFAAKSFFCGSEVSEVCDTIGFDIASMS